MQSIYFEKFTPITILEFPFGNCHPGTVTPVSIHDSGWSLAWDHFRGVIVDPCGVIMIPDAIGGFAVTDVVIGDSSGTDAICCMTH